MKIIIKSKNEFEKLLLNEGWTQTVLVHHPNSPLLSDFVSPFNPNIFFEKYAGGDFWTEIPYKHKPKGKYNKGSTGRKAVLASITNFQDFTWEYDTVTGYITNGFCTIRIK